MARTIVARHASATLASLLETFPVLVITGARQVGKSTLALQLARERGGSYLTLDDIALRAQALADPHAFVSGREGMLVIDEVQLAPELFRAIKLAVDRDRTPGRFLLTGSANPLRMRSVGESLAGRSAWFELGPLTWAEIDQQPFRSVIDLAFGAKNASALVAALAQPATSSLVKRACERAIQGGMPATLGLTSAARYAWYQAYRQTFLERDLRQLGDIENLPEFTRLLRLATLRSASLLNKSSLATDAGLSHATLRRYLALLEVAYQLFELAPFHSNRGKRLVKTPKLYATDVGLVTHLDGVESFEEATDQERAGALVETWVVNELLAIDRLSARRSTATFFRTSAGREVDLVLERGREVVAIEIKASATVDHAATLGLRELREQLGARLKLGIIGYLGRDAAALDPSLCLLPLSTLLGLSGREVEQRAARGRPP
jgi:predicted AAA+ superfamily ATPase